MGVGLGTGLMGVAAVAILFLALLLCINSVVQQIRRRWKAKKTRNGREKEETQGGTTC